MNPNGDVVWECEQSGKARQESRRLFRIDLGHYLEIVQHSTVPSQVVARMWMEGRIEMGEPMQWEELQNERERENGTHAKFARQAEKVAAAIASHAR